MHTNTEVKCWCKLCYNYQASSICIWHIMGANGWLVFSSPFNMSSLGLAPSSSSSSFCLLHSSSPIINI
jgi:hypothetical protein